MTEPEWLASGDPRAMFRHCHGLLSDRKKRLYLVGCCRDVWDEIEDEGSRQAVLAAERFADGLAPADELQLAYYAAYRTYWLSREIPDPGGLRAQIAAAAAGTVWGLESNSDLPWAIGPETGLARDAARQAELLRCVLGNPFRPVTLDPSWLTSTVASLAQGIYAERAFDRLPILCDALQDAGCDSADILDHCRGPGPHARGCWVIDLVLGEASR
jgi:hypothetical protein